MSLFTITTDTSNKDIPEGMGIKQAREYYLAWRGDFQSALPPPVVERFEDKWVFRGDKSAVSLKGYGAEQLVAQTKEHTLVYCAPRVGMAMDAIASVARMHNKKCVFFCPASAEPSKYQRALLDYGAELRFIKIAAMPTLNGYARKWAEKNGAKYLPFGLANTPLVTSGIVHLATNATKVMGKEPSEVWMSVSTGTAIRAFQIAWPKSEIKGIVVARNMHDGEIGNASLYSADTPFLRDVKPSERPPFPSTANYDAKCWRDFYAFAKPDSIFINVGCDDKVDAMVKKVAHIQIDSQRGWGDMTDFDRGL